MKRLIIVANRLPVKVNESENGINYKLSEGGLATGLNSLSTDIEKYWVGWPGIYPGQENTKQLITQELKEKNIHPVYLTEEQVCNYYEGFSNETIWPLFHYFSEFVNYNHDTWETYKEVNELFCEKIAEIAEPDDVIWVQDYHLMLLPEMLKKRLPNNQIGFFLHIPFPSYELFRTLPWREELLTGLLGADLIGFHTYEYMRHFMISTYRILGLEANLGEIRHGDRSVMVDTFPMGINYEKFNSSVKNNEVKTHVQNFKNGFGDVKLILSVDRLDYSKGIINRLHAFEKLLDENPGYRGNISLVMLVVPSRDKVDDYKRLKEEVNELVGHINGKYASIRWAPVYYFYQSLPFEELAALYNIADIGLVTPLRDGMNLVAKEFVATRQDGSGVLILSEMAGSAIEMTEALQINPNDINDISSALKRALEMTEEEQERRIFSMQRTIKKQTVQKWANDFIGSLNGILAKQYELEQKIINGYETREIRERFNYSEKQLILLDYDGTLVPFSQQPQMAVPDQELLDLLSGISRRSSTRVVLISGRDHQTLEKWFGDLDIDLVAEHGTWQKRDGMWKQVAEFNDLWKPDVKDILEEFEEKTPGSFIEEKPFSLAWHYRNANTWLTEMRVPQLINALANYCSRKNLEILDGNKVIEIKIAGVDKGTATNEWVNKDSWDFILAAGDDRTDEDMFKVLSRDAISVKVGSKNTAARFRVNSHLKIRELLSELLQVVEEEYDHKIIEFDPEITLGRAI